MNKHLCAFAALTLVLCAMLGSAAFPAWSQAQDAGPASGAPKLPIENVEGVILLRADLSGATRDTSGLLVLDTGAGYFGLDGNVARRLDLVGENSTGSAMQLTDRALRQLRFGDLAIDQVAPVLLLDLSVVRRVTGRSALGLLGQRVFTGRALWIDYEDETIRVLPNPPTPASKGRGGASGTATADPAPELLRESRDLFGDLSTKAVAVPFRLLGDGKMLVRVHAGSSRSAARGEAWLNLVFDTGATQCVLFEPDLGRLVPASKSWRSVEGLIAPTLFGDARARLALAPGMSVQVAGPDRHHSATQHSVECAVVRTDLAATLSAAVGESVHGLLGYSFLRSYRVGIDFTRNLVWLDPTGRPAGRPLEHTHVGIQLESVEGGVRVSAVAKGSPAERGGIAAGDELISVDGKPVREDDVVEVARRLEGRAGSTVRIVVRHEGAERAVALVRRRML